MLGISWLVMIPLSMPVAVTNATRQLSNSACSVSPSRLHAFTHVLLMTADVYLLQLLPGFIFSLSLLIRANCIEELGYEEVHSSLEQWSSADDNTVSLLFQMLGEAWPPCSVCELRHKPLALSPPPPPRTPSGPHRPCHASWKHAPWLVVPLTSPLAHGCGWVHAGIASWAGADNTCADNIQINAVTFLFLLLTMIVLLNLLIAMFTDTYERIQVRVLARHVHTSSSYSHWASSRKGCWALRCAAFAVFIR